MIAVLILNVKGDASRFILLRRSSLEALYVLVRAHEMEIHPLLGIV